MLRQHLSFAFVCVVADHTFLKLALGFYKHHANNFQVFLHEWKRAFNKDSAVINTVNSPISGHLLLPGN